MSAPVCRFCQAPLTVSVADLGLSPLANAYRTADTLAMPERFHPLHAFFCTACFLVQLGTPSGTQSGESASPEVLFSEYAYFSSCSESWLAHARQAAETAIRRFGLDGRSQVTEVASNDGYLLRWFQACGIPVLGVEPAANIAKVAQEAGIPSVVEFFGRKTAENLFKQGYQSDLLIGNNVLAHVPDINDFVSGLKTLLKPDGVIMLEFPHLLRLIRGNQFDTIYHEHFSYFSLLAVEKIFNRHGLVVFDVEELSTHGGSLRIYVRHAPPHPNPPPPGGRGQEFSLAGQGEESLGKELSPLPPGGGGLGWGGARIKAEERAFGLDRAETYRTFHLRIQAVKRDLLSLLIRLKTDGKRIAAYGAAAKGNTLLNYCGIRTDFIDYVADSNAYKQGRYLPGTHIPVVHPDWIAENRPDYILIPAWNIADEIMEKLAYTAQWNAQFILPIPEVRVVSPKLPKTPVSSSFPVTGNPEAPHSPKIPVLIAGIGGASLGMEMRKALTLAGRYAIYGCDVSDLAYGHSDVGFERTFRVNRECYVENILALCREHQLSLILPGGEEPLALLSAVTERLAREGVRLACNASSVVSVLSDKAACFRRLRELGVPTPETREINPDFTGVTSDTLEGMPFPCIVKPASASGGSVFVFLAGDAAEAMLYVDYLTRNGKRALVQEYVDDAEGEFTVGVLSLPDGSLAGSVALRRLFHAKLSVREKSRLGVISSGYSQGLIEDFPGIRAQCEQISLALGSTGPMNIQGRVRNGQFIPFEINPRFSASTYLRTLAGFNEIDLYLQAVLTGERPADLDTFTLKPGYYLRSLTESYWTPSLTRIEVF